MFKNYQFIYKVYFLFQFEIILYSSNMLHNNEFIDGNEERMYYIAMKNFHIFLKKAVNIKDYTEYQVNFQINQELTNTVVNIFEKVKKRDHQDLNQN